MLNPRLDLLSDYPFTKLRALLDAESLSPDLRPLNLSIGEPQHAMPDFVVPELTADLSSLSRYPTANGSPDLRAAIVAWLNRRYQLPDALLDPERQIVPLNGTREGIYMIAQVVVPEQKAGGRPLVLMPKQIGRAACRERVC